MYNMQLHVPCAPFQCLSSVIRRGLRLISDGTSICLILSSTTLILSCKLLKLPWLRASLIHIVSTNFETPRSAKCMYSGVTPFTRFEYFKQLSQIGHFTPYTYKTYHSYIYSYSVCTKFIFKVYTYYGFLSSCCFGMFNVAMMCSRWPFWR